MKVVLAGGTGFIGRHLVHHLTSQSHIAVLLARNPASVGSVQNVVVVKWDGRSVGEWAQHVDGADAVFNFAGESIAAKRWTAKRKREVIGSRLDATNTIVAAIERAKVKPQVLVNASAVGYYGDVPDGDLTEDHARGTGFLAETTGLWEEEARKAEAHGVRVVLLRIGVVLGADGGALPKMLLPFRLGLGGVIGSGRQWFPWIHIDDLVAIAMFAAENRNLSGPVNAIAPEAVTMREFCARLGAVLRRPSWAPVPAFILRMVLGEMAEILLTGQKVVPTKLLKAGFKFRYPHLNGALREILQ